eukprot:g22601.t1
MKVHEPVTDKLKGAAAGTADIVVRQSLSEDGAHEVPFHQGHMGGMLSSDQKVLYFVGIIDILTPYDGRKHLEHWFKALRYDSRGVSCCPPAITDMAACSIANVKVVDGKDRCRVDEDFVFEVTLDVAEPLKEDLVFQCVYITHGSGDEVELESIDVGDGPGLRQVRSRVALSGAGLDMLRAS